MERFLFLAALVLNDERQGIVFIDEPESRLDPQWHGLIMPLDFPIPATATMALVVEDPLTRDTLRAV